MFSVVQFTSDNSLAVIQDKDIKGDMKMAEKVLVIWGKNKKEWEGVIRAVTDDRKTAETQLKIIRKTNNASAALSSISSHPSTSEQTTVALNNKRLADLLQENGEFFFISSNHFISYSLQHVLN